MEADLGPQDVILRVHDESLLQDAHLPVPAAARPWAPGLAQSLAFDRPDSIQMITEPELDAWGLSWDDIATIGLRNLAKFLPELGEPNFAAEAGFHFFESPSLLTASHALHLPLLVDRIEPNTEISGGILFIVPFRHFVGLHVIQEGSRWVTALNAMSTTTNQLARSAPTPISSSVYLWRNGEVTRVSVIEDGRIQVYPDAYLASLLIPK